MSSAVPSLITERLALLPLRVQDADTLARLIDDYDVAVRLARVPHPYPPGAAQDFIKRATQAEAADDGITRAVRLKDGTMIGCISLYWPGDDIPTLGYWLAKAYWGQGYMGEALRRFLAYAFEHDDVQRITANVFKDNAESLRLLEKLGFTRLGETSGATLLRPHVEKWVMGISNAAFQKNKTASAAAG